MEEIVERIESARSDADWNKVNGHPDRAHISISLADCGVIGDFLTKAFGCALVGRRDAEIAETLAILAGAFKGDDADDDGGDDD